ncbi:MAG TPA: hypothetical protein VN833_22050, partial [Candidatus Acidoferrales bacterium]|nr:hypothetical protein [Candidatus Acidoferrales bacterium]
DPYNWVMALKNADNSRSAMVMRSAQPELGYFYVLWRASGFIFLNSRSRRTAIDRPPASG